MTRDAHGGFQIAIAVTTAQILRSLALLFEIQIRLRITWKGHQTTLH